MSKSSGRDLDTILQDTQRKVLEKHAREAQLTKKYKVEPVQISTVSDMVLHDRFDSEFNQVIKEMEKQQWDKLTNDETTDVFTKLGFVQEPLTEEA